MWKSFLVWKSRQEKYYLQKIQKPSYWLFGLKIKGLWESSQRGVIYNFPTFTSWNKQWRKIAWELLIFSALFSSFKLYCQFLEIWKSGEEIRIVCISAYIMTLRNKDVNMRAGETPEDGQYRTGTHLSTQTTTSNFTKNTEKYSPLATTSHSSSNSWSRPRRTCGNDSSPMRYPSCDVETDLGWVQR